MTAPTTADMHAASESLQKAIAKHDWICRQIGGIPELVDTDTGEVIRQGVLGAEAIYKRAWLEAHTESTTMHPDRTVGEHKTVADQAAFDEWAQLNAFKSELKALKEKMHSLRQVLSAYQTQARSEADATRYQT